MEQGGIVKVSEQGQDDLILTREEMVREARNFTLFSDTFVTVALNDIPACQHVLRILTGIQDLKVKEIRTQYVLEKVVSHGARLDVLAEDNQGKLYSMEIQATDTVDHARRTRFYGAMIDSSFLQKGESYENLPEVHIIYVSKQDLWKEKKTAYPVEKYFKGTNQVYKDGMHILYVNAAVDDGTETAKLMKYFMTADPNDDS